MKSSSKCSIVVSTWYSTVYTREPGAASRAFVAPSVFFFFALFVWPSLSERPRFTISTVDRVTLSPVPVASPEARAPIALGAKDLAFTPTELRLYKAPDTGKHYWYMTYEVVNKTGKEVRFSPRVELVVDDGVVLSQGEGVPSDVVQKLKKHQVCGLWMLSRQHVVTRPLTRPLVAATTNKHQTNTRNTQNRSASWAWRLAARSWCVCV